jgi:hypothetical protein
MSVTLKPVAPIGRTRGPRDLRENSGERGALTDEAIAGGWPGFG